MVIDPGLPGLPVFPPSDDDGNGPDPPRRRRKKKGGPGGGPLDGDGPDSGDGKPPKKPDDDDSDPSSSDSSSDDSDTRRKKRKHRRRKGKELDKVSVLPFFAASGWYEWKRHFKTKVRVASGRLDSKIVPYVNEAFAIEFFPDDAKFAKVESVDARRWATLGPKIVEAFLGIKAGNLGRQWQETVDQYQDRGDDVPFRVLLRQMARHFQTSSVRDSMFRLSDLQTVQVRNGDLEGFQRSWDVVCNRMPPGELPKNHKRETYYDAIVNVKAMAEDVSFLPTA